MDPINSSIGSFGRYQLWICFIIFVSKFGVGMHQMAIIFLAPPVKYTCLTPNVTCCDNPVFDKTEFYRTIVTEWNLTCRKTWLKDFTQTLFQFGVLVGSFVFGVASDRYGRRNALLISVILEIFTGVMVAFLPDYWSFTIIRMILGFSIGGIMVVGFVLVMEYVGIKNRDVISSLFHVPFTLGHMILGLFGYFLRDYVNFQIGISLSSFLLLAYICVLPESPRWLLAMNKTFKAIKLMEKIARINGFPEDEVHRNVETHQLDSSRKRPKKGTVVDLFRTPNLRKNIIVMSFNWFVSSYCYYGIAQYSSHLTGNIYINVVAGGSVCALGCLLVIPLVRYLGRKILVMSFNIACSMCLLIIIFVPEGIGTIIMGCLGVLFSFMSFIVTYLYCSEMFPTVVRNAAIGISSTFARLGAMVAPFVAALRPFGQWCAPVAFAILPIIAALTCLLLPGKLVQTVAAMKAGLIVCAAWYYTILAGFYILYCPVMYLMFINHKFYRQVVDLLFALWELYPVALFQWCCKTELHHYGSYVNPDETTIILMNHRTRVDWNYVWIALYHATQKKNANVKCNDNKLKSKSCYQESDICDIISGGRSKIKFVLKDEIKAVPGMGWIMQLNYFLYVKRSWQEDQLSLSQYVDYYKRLKYYQRVVLFPEGTDLSEDNKRRSAKFATSKQLPIYEYVLHPRTTGWAVLCSRLRDAGLKSVYDVTVAYDQPAQTELDLLRGNIPKHAYFHFRRYPIEELPHQEDELRSWLQDRWQEKNNSLENFHNDGSFIDFSTKTAPEKREPRSLAVAKIAFLIWTVFDMLFIYALYYSVLFRFWVIYHTLLFILVTKYFGGFHNIQYRILDKITYIIP